MLTWLLRLAGSTAALVTLSQFIPGNEYVRRVPRVQRIILFLLTAPHNLVSSCRNGCCLGALVCQPRRSPYQAIQKQEFGTSRPSWLVLTLEQSVKVQYCLALQEQQDSPLASLYHLHRANQLCQLANWNGGPTVKRPTFVGFAFPILCVCLDVRGQFQG